MKKILFIAILGLSCSSFAWTETTPVQKEYSFKFIAKDIHKDDLKLKKTAPSYEDAFQAAAQECFSHYKGSGHVSEDMGLRIIDICANPRS